MIAFAHLVEHRGLHAVVQKSPVARRQVRRKPHMRAQHGQQILVPYELAPEVTAVAQHHREQPQRDNLFRVRSKCSAKLRKVHLRLGSGSGLEAMLEAADWLRAQLRTACFTKP